VQKGVEAAAKKLISLSEFFVNLLQMRALMMMKMNCFMFEKIFVVMILRFSEQ
jgi:hypothetical protein